MLDHGLERGSKPVGADAVATDAVDGRTETSLANDGATGPAGAHAAGRAAGPTVRTLRSAAAFSAAVAVALLVWAATGAGTDYTRTAVASTALVVTVLLATASCVRTASRRAGETRLGWALLAVAMMFLVVVEIANFVYQVVLDRSVPVLVGFFDVAEIPIALVAVLVLANGFLSAVERARVAIDGGIIALAIMFLSWEQLLEPISVAAGLSGTERQVDVVNSIGDAVVVGAVVALALRTRRGGRVPLALVACGLTGIAAGDFALPYLAATDHNSLVPVFDAVTTAAYLLIALGAMAACTPTLPGRSAAGPQEAGWLRVAAELLPYPIALAALTVGIFHGFRDEDGSYTSLLVALGVALLGLVAARAALSILANAALARGLRLHAVQLEQLSEQQESILNSAGDGIYGIDAEGRITFVNDAAVRMLSSDGAGALVGQPHEIALAQQDGDGDGSPTGRADSPLAVTLRGTSSHSAVVNYRSGDGTVFPAEHTATSIRQDGTVVGAVVVFRDVTERRAVERMRNEFISVVSHELRTPLTSVRGALGLLAGGALGQLPDRAQRMADVAVDSTDRLIRLINDILDVERMAAGKLVLKRQTCQATDLLAGAVEAMKPYAEGAGVTLRTEASDDAVWADPDRICQTLTNLIGNAVKFSPRGGTVTLRATPQGGAVLFQVSDEGRGIPPDKLETIFGKFQQVDASDSRQKGGTGLGLAICRGIVEQHGGRIWADSQPGAGSTFSFRLPAVGPRAVGSSGSESVLLCDDDPELLEVLGKVLETQGYRVVLATSGQEALERATAEPPAVIVMDLLMPEMNGWETVAELKRRPETADVPVVILSGLAPENTDTASAEDWVPKLLGPGALIAALERVLEARVSPGRVLVVEDDEALGQVLLEMFTARGLDAALAVTGEQAVELSRRLHPQLLILDLDLPGLDGFGVVERLRLDDQLRSVLVVVYTALELSEADRRRLALGETHFMTKSRTSPDEFERRVVGLLNRVATEASAQAESQDQPAGRDQAEGDERTEAPA